MIRFILGSIFGLIIGAVAVLVFTALGTFGNPLAYTPLPSPGQAVIHVSVDQSYLNQQLSAVLATQPQFANSNPQLSFRPPNVAVLTAGVQIQAGNSTFNVRPTVTMQFQVEGGVIKTHITGVNMGTLNLPTTLVKGPMAELESTLDDEMNRAVAGALSGTGLKVYNVSAAQGMLLVDLGE